MRLIPKGLERRLRPRIERAEAFLRDWEWTWTKAFVAGILISFVALGTLVVIPSWWLYFANNQLQWQGRLLISVRDSIALGWLLTWTVIFVLVPYLWQKTRQRVRGEKGSERYSGGYR